ncbi:TRAP transporter permease [Fictibacillus terranigra]|uniref:FxsA family protein n=1 Tax=Fictibacillus terranigra TaxID=3058424 RepID=A0ABT8EBX1_9BACL|nr:FxsA family protein [Fictibacillus sp. CENA-BCM004]MDN4075428.1 FxsA family protein [Fictibacillus sp. CENA-BCM004]
MGSQKVEKELGMFRAFFKEGNRRELKGLFRKLILTMSIILCIFEVWLGAIGSMDLYQYTTVFYPLLLTAAFLQFSSTKRVKGQQPTWLDIIMASLSLGIGIYFLLNIDLYLKRIPLFTPLTPLELAVGIATVLLTLEATRRTLGFTLTSVVLVILAYVSFGQHIQGAYSHRPIDFNHFLDDMVFTVNGIFGTPLGVAATYVFLFVLFGAFFTAAGGGDFFFRLAATISGRRVGGPAKITVITSGMFGMISGSPTSDVLTTGSINIPTMKKMGYSPIFAGGVESAASTGGSILPPIMGSAAFLMAEYAGISYGAIVIAATIPAILYYLGIFLQVHFRSIKQNMPTLKEEEIPKVKDVIKDGWMYLVPLVFLVIGIMNGMTASLAAVLATAIVLVCSWLKPGYRIGFKKLILIFEEVIERMVPVTMACAAAGMLIDGIMLTGLSSKFGTLIFSLTTGSLFFTLMATAVLCIILGMGMPVSSAYILTAVLAAPLLINMNIPVMNAHLFIVYYSCLSAITPPVAVAAFAAASIAQADPVKIGLNACKLAIVAFILPFMFVYDPGILLQGNLWDIASSIVLSVIAVIAIAAAVEGWYKSRMNMIEQVVLFAGGLLLIVPGMFSHVIGLLITVTVISLNRIKAKKIMNQLLLEKKTDDVDVMEA